jgi:hypothetical protein
MSTAWEITIHTVLVECLVLSAHAVVFGVRDDWDQPQVEIIPVDRTELMLFVESTFGSGEQVRELVELGVEEVRHGYDRLIVPVSRWTMQRGNEIVGDQDLSLLGKVNPIALSLGHVVLLGPTCDHTEAGYDILLQCVIHPHSGCSFRFARLVVDLSATSHAIVRDMAPREVHGAGRTLEVDRRQGARLLWPAAGLLVLQS